jgi:hypothetical protein
MHNDRVDRTLQHFPISSLFLLSMSVQPWYNFIENNPSRSAVSLQDNRSRAGEHIFEESIEWRLPMTAPRP